MDDNKTVATIGKEYRQVRGIRLDQLVEKTRYMEVWYDALEEEALAFFNAQLNLLQSGTTPDHERLYNAVSDRMAQTLANIRSAREAQRTACTHITSAMFYGIPANLINIEALDHENKEF